MSSVYTPGDFYFEEVSSQPEAWAKIIPLVTDKKKAIQELFEGIDEVIFTGCGSGYNASLCGAPIFQTLTGISTHAVPAADTYLFPQSVLSDGRRSLAILISRSGETTEVVHSLDYLHDQGIRILGITCTAGSPLASGSDLAFVLSPVVERSVVTTRSLTGMILTTQLIAAIISGDGAYMDELQRLPMVCKPHMQTFHELGKTIGQNEGLTKYAFVGNGPFFGHAHESQLKVKEMALLPVDSYPVLDFRHGPQSNVDEQMLVAVFISDSARKEEVCFLQDMKALGGVTWVLCDRVDNSIKENADYLLEVNSGLSELARGVLYMPPVQYMAYYRALSRGHNPDEPWNLSYWVDTSN